MSRAIKLMGTDGEIRGVIARDRRELEIIHFASGSPETVSVFAEGGPKGTAAAVAAEGSRLEHRTISREAFRHQVVAAARPSLAGGSRE